MRLATETNFISNVSDIMTTLTEKLFRFLDTKLRNELVRGATKALGELLGKRCSTDACDICEILKHQFF